MSEFEFGVKVFGELLQKLAISDAAHEGSVTYQEIAAAARTFGVVLEDAFNQEEK